MGCTRAEVTGAGVSDVGGWWFMAEQPPGTDRSRDGVGAGVNAGDDPNRRRGANHIDGAWFGACIMHAVTHAVTHAIAHLWHEL